MNMKYFIIFSLAFHFSIFVLMIWKDHQFPEADKKSKIIIEIISTDSDSLESDLFPEKRKILKKSQKKSYPTHWVSSFPKKKPAEKLNLVKSEKTIIQEKGFNENVQRDLSSQTPYAVKHKIQIKLNYVQQLKTYIDENKFYPRAALKLNQTGVVKIRLEITPEGLFKNVTVIRASAHENLNRAALKLVKNLRHFKPLPGIFQGRTPFIIPIAYIR